MSDYLRSAIRCDYRLVSQVSVSVGGEVQCQSEVSKIALELQRNEDLLRRVDAPPVTLTSWPIGHSSAWNVEEVVTPPAPARGASAHWAQVSSRIEDNRKRQQAALKEISRCDDEIRMKAAAYDAAMRQPSDYGLIRGVPLADESFTGPVNDIPAQKVHPIDVLHNKVNECIMAEVTDFEEKFIVRERLCSAHSRRGNF